MKKLSLLLFGIFLLQSVKAQVFDPEVIGKRLELTNLQFELIDSSHLVGFVPSEIIDSVLAISHVVGIRFYNIEENNHNVMFLSGVDSSGWDVSDTYWLCEAIQERQFQNRKLSNQEISGILRDTLFQISKYSSFYTKAMLDDVRKTGSLNNGILMYLTPNKTNPSHLAIAGQQDTLGVASRASTTIGVRPILNANISDIHFSPHHITPSVMPTRERPLRGQHLMGYIPVEQIDDITVKSRAAGIRIYNLEDFEGNSFILFVGVRENGFDIMDTYWYSKVLQQRPFSEKDSDPVFTLHNLGIRKNARALLDSIADTGRELFTSFISRRMLDEIFTDALQDGISVYRRSAVGLSLETNVITAVKLSDGEIPIEVNSGKAMIADIHCPNQCVEEVRNPITGEIIQIFTISQPSRSRVESSFAGPYIKFWF